MSRYTCFGHQDNCHKGCSMYEACLKITPKLPEKMSEKMDWRKLYFGHMPIKEVLEAVKDPGWQVVRLSMKGRSLESKYDRLLKWLIICDNSRQAQVQVTNYVTALSRGGLIKPEDYR